MAKTIVIVEDETDISDILEFNITKEGYNAIQAFDGEAGLNKALLPECDLVLLDIMLPKMNGFEVLEQLRKTSSVPVIMLTAKEGEDDKIKGLELGADDYITKPFSLKELLVRIKANLRRSTGDFAAQKSEGAVQKVLKSGEIELDTDKYEVRKNGKQLSVTAKEYEVLKLFMLNPEKVFTREMLLEQVWGYDDFLGDLHTVDVMISRIRKKIEDNPAEPKYIVSKRGAGYIFALI
ncbi:MAG: response regulator transcription factor [Ruminococcaceae bacterium]|nr:response regulator transcription factor [Oscillospiraceae bacterium]